MTGIDRRIEGLSPERRMLFDGMRRERRAATEPIGPRPPDERIPLSSQQTRLWFLEQLDPGSAAYNVYEAVRLLGSLDETALERAFGAVEARHEALRTWICEEHGRPFQAVTPHRGIRLELIDLRELGRDEQEAEVLRHAHDTGRAPFDLGVAPLLRARLLRLTEDEHVLVLAMHHIVSDGWSLGLLIGELSAFYEAYRQGVNAEVSPPAVQYGDYAHWQRFGHRPRVGADISFWRDQLAGAPAAITLPTDRPYPVRRDSAGGRHVFTIDATITAAVTQLGTSGGATPFMTFLAAFAVTLMRSGAGDDICIGSPVAGRTRPELEDVIGPFINILVLRARLDGDPTFREVIQRVRATALDAFDHEETPFEEVVDAVQPERLQNRSPLFQVLFVLQNTPLPPATGSLDLAVLQTHNGTAKFDLTLTLTPAGEGMTASLEYASDIFDGSTVERLARSFSRLLFLLTRSPDEPLSRLTILDEAERALVVDRWNDTYAAVPAGAVHEWIAAQVRAHPARIAVRSADGLLTYGRLDAVANALADRLVGLGVEPDRVVGVRLERSAELVVALLAVLKAGGAYLPLDPDHPDQRLRAIVDDAGAMAVIGRPGGPSLGPVAVELPSGWTRDAPEAHHPPAAPVDPAGLAYVIYTSGSTGTPKGVMSTHAGLANRLWWMQKRLQLDADDRVLQKTPFGFDVSVWEFFWPLIAGACVVVAPPDSHRDPVELASLVVAEDLTTMHFVPSMLRLFLAEPTTARCRPSLRRVIASGEAMTPDLVQRFGAVLDAELHNLYGPTEASIDVSAWQCQPADANARRVPIGRPIANTRLYVLDDRMAPVGIGVVGELCIGGVGLARGYAGQPGLTAAAFVPDPFSPGSRLYRTGDLARWRASGELEYVGRNDDQVKIRGVRVEPGEVVSAIEAHPSVRLAAVVAHTAAAGDTVLAAYVVPALPLDADTIRRFLAGRLPEALIPSAVCFVDELPRTASGKIDHGKLPPPLFARDQTELVPPSTPAEVALAEVWQDVLGVDKVGVTDNFFSLGGDSIRSVQVVAQARELGLGLSVRQIFDHQSIRELAAVVSAIEDTSAPRQPFALVTSDDAKRMPAAVVDAYPLSALQAAMIFDTELATDFSIYHDVFSFHIEGPLDRAALASAVDQVVARHAVLRTSFDLTSFSEPLQLVHGEGAVRVEFEEISSLPRVEQDAVVSAWVKDEKAKPFRWDAPSLLRIRVHDRGPSSFQFSLSCHNVILDGWSMASLLSELFLAARAGGGEAARPDPVATYRDFIELEQAALASAEARSFWESTLQAFPPAPLPRWPHQSAAMAGRRVEIVDIDPHVGEALGGLARRLGVPLKSVLLAAHLRVVGAATGTRRAVTGVVTNGRPEASGADQVLGLFLNVVPVGAVLSGGTWESLVRQAFEAERAMQPFRRYPMARLRIEAGIPWFDTACNFVNFHVYDGLMDAGLRVLDATTYDDTNFTLWTEFSIDPRDGTLHLDLSYESAALPEPQVRALAGMYGRVLGLMADAPESSSAAETVLGVKGMEWAVRQGTGAHVPLPSATVSRLFDAAVDKYRDAMAFACSGEQLTFAELDARVRRLASRLQRFGIGRHDVVGVSVTRSLDAPVALLAILRVGAAYLPLDPAYPAARLAMMAEDAGTMAVVVAGAKPLFSTAAPVFDMHDEVAGDMFAERAEPVEPVDPHPDDVAYVVFTSGSTGRPKGVSVPHRQVVNRLLWMWQEHPFGPDEVASQKTSLSFVDSLWELLGPLLAGVPTVIVPDEVVRDPDRLVKELDTHRVTRLWLVPSLLRALLAGGGSLAERLPCLTFWVTSGEPLPTDLLRAFEEAMPHAVLYNLYGTSEVWDATWFDPRTAPSPESGVPIGKPIWNTTAYVLDHSGVPAPAGVPGELAIGGVGVAHGYLNAASSTAAKFVPDPFGPPGARLYLTGDLACVLPDGDIHFMGRFDNQVQIRGVRVEPAEVEAVLRTHPALANAVVLVQGTEGDPRLVAYLVPKDGAGVDRDDVRRLVREVLPSFLHPAGYAVVDRLPLTPSGKLDRLAFARTPEDDGAVAGGAAATPAEEILCGLFAELFGREGVGAGDDFLSLGGHSLMAMQLVARIRNVFSVELPVRTLFEAPSIAALAAEVSALRGLPLTRPALSPMPRLEGDAFPASHAQRRLWFLHQLSPDSAAYNVFAAVRLHGLVNVHALAGALEKVVERHESLRTTFEFVDDDLLQRVRPSLAPEFVALDGEVDVEDVVCRPFDLATGPLVRAAVGGAGDDHVAVLVVHHVVCDGWSMEILLRELMEAYAGEPSWSPLPIQYADYAAWQRSALTPYVLDALCDRVKARLEHATGALPLGRAAAGAAGADDAGAIVERLLAPEVRDAVWALARSQGCTPFMVLFAAFDVVLAARTGVVDIVIGTDVAGRGEVELDGLIGFFVNQLVLRLRLDGDPAFDEVLDSARVATLDAYADQELPHDVLVERMRPARGPHAGSPLFEVKLVLQNVPEQEPPTGDLRVEVLPAERGTAQLPLNLRVAHRPDGLLLSAEFATSRFDAADVDALLAALEDVLGAVIAEPRSRLSALQEVVAASDQRLREAAAARLRAVRGDRLRVMARRRPAGDER